MTSYAWREITLIVLIGGILSAVTAWFAGWWALAPATIAGTVLSFYRDPPRRVPDDPQAILSAADGKVVSITRESDPANGEAILRIMAFLSVLNVHINRSPCAGRVTEVTYQPGEFLSALRAAADTRNENNTVVITPDEPLPGPVRVRQIAGVLARRIVCTANSDTHLAAGERFGMIKLGSRTEVILPDNGQWDLCVCVGQRVRAGRTILARLHSS